ncbi:MAG: hypothetical protein R3261_01755, partial [Alphaproteobacteria bacterium]|nr:hypothetical protein [Alphaproteobacteria bacterium]
MSKILIVEDDHKSRETVISKLTKAGHDTFIVDNLHESPESFEDIHPDLILCSFNNPENAKLLKLSVDLHPSVPFVFMLPKENLALLQETLKPTTDGYVLKPLDFQKLTSIIETRLDTYQRQYAWLHQQLDNIFEKIFENEELAVGKFNNIESLFGYYQAKIKDLNSEKLDTNLMTRMDFSVRTLEDADKVGRLIAEACPSPETAVLGIIELIVNGIEHGNLGVGYDLKTQLLETGKWTDEIKRRLALPENKNKTVSVSVIKRDNKLEIKIEDMGSGFEPDRYRSFSADRLSHLHGRGIALAES